MWVTLVASGPARGTHHPVSLLVSMGQDGGPPWGVRGTHWLLMLHLPNFGRWRWASESAPLGSERAASAGRTAAPAARGEAE